MLQSLNLDYFHGNESSQYYFFRIPKVLFENECYSRISLEAKVLYSLLLDRVTLSMRNNWRDNENRVYIYFSQQEAMQQMNCRRDKVIRMFKELDVKHGVGLIERKRRGFGKPDIIYVKNFLGLPAAQEMPGNAPSAQNPYTATASAAFAVQAKQNADTPEMTGEEVSAIPEPTTAVPPVMMKTEAAASDADAANGASGLSGSEKEKPGAEELTFEEKRRRVLEQIRAYCKPEQKNQILPSASLSPAAERTSEKSTSELNNACSFSASLPCEAGQLSEKPTSEIHNAFSFRTSSPYESEQMSEKPTSVVENEVIFQNSPSFLPCGMERTSEMPTSESRDFRPPEVGKTDPNHIYQSQNKKKETEGYSIPLSSPMNSQGNEDFSDRMDLQSRMRYFTDVIRENIGYEALLRSNPMNGKEIDNYVALMAEVCCSRRKVTRINGEDMETSVVKNQYLKLNLEHIEYVMDCMRKNHTMVKNIRAYLRTALFNAVNTIEPYYNALVSHDNYEYEMRYGTAY